MQTPGSHQIWRQLCPGRCNQTGYQPLAQKVPLIQVFHPVNYFTVTGSWGTRYIFNHVQLLCITLQSRCSWAVPHGWAPMAPLLQHSHTAGRSPESSRHTSATPHLPSVGTWLQWTHREQMQTLKSVLAEIPCVEWISSLHITGPKPTWCLENKITSWVHSSSNYLPL